MACDAPWVQREAGGFPGGLPKTMRGAAGSGYSLEVVAAACHHVYSDVSESDTCCYLFPMQVRGVRERERERTWWDHTGGGHALAFKQPT